MVFAVAVSLAAVGAVAVNVAVVAVVAAVGKCCC